MRVTEISNNARKIIQQMNSLFITYSTYGKVDSYYELWDMIEENIDSTDPDVRKQVLFYKIKLTNDLIRILGK